MAGSFLESYFLIQKESVFGTPVSSAMTSLTILSWDVQPSYDLYESNMITGAAGAPAPAFGVKRVAGRLTMEGGYSGLDHVLYGVMGSGTNSGTTTPFVNDYTASASMPSFTAHVGYGAIPDSTHNFVFSGIKFNTVDIAFDAAQGLMNVAADIIAYDETSTATAGTAKGTIANTVTHEPIFVTNASPTPTIDIGVGASGAYCVRSGNIKVERFLTPNRICLGRSLVQEAVPTRPMKVSGTFNVEFIDRTLYDIFVAKTEQSTVEFKWFNTGSTHYFDVAFPRLSYLSALPPIQSGDVLVAAVNWIAYGTSTNEPCAFHTKGLVDFDTL